MLVPRAARCATPRIGDMIPRGVVGIAAAVAPAANDAWAFGSANNAKLPYAAHYTGGRWTTVASFPVFADSASASSASDIWVMGASDRGFVVAIVHWNGRTWQRSTLPHIAVPSGDAFISASILAVGPSSAWAVANLVQRSTARSATVLLHWNGTSWARVAVPAAAGYAEGLTQDGDGGIWLSASAPPSTPSTRLFHYNGGHWSSYPAPGPAGKQATVNQLAWISGTSLWGAGQRVSDSTGASQGLIVKYGP